MKYSYQITEYCHRFLEMYIEPGDVCVDARTGRGQSEADISPPASGGKQANPDQRRARIPRRTAPAERAASCGKTRRTAVIDSR